MLQFIAIAALRVLISSSVPDRGKKPAVSQLGPYYYLGLREAEPLYESVEPTGIRDAQSDAAVRRWPAEPRRLVGAVDRSSIIANHGQVREAHIPSRGIETFSLCIWCVCAGLGPPPLLPRRYSPRVFLATRDVDRHALLRKVNSGADGRRTSGA